jgi:adenine-specific DNA-methyltransferase
LPKFFKGKRILVREITNPSIFAAYTDEEFYHDPSIIVVLDNGCNAIKFLLAILNSRLASFYHFNSSPKATKGAFPKILVTDIKNFPIPKISPEQQQPFIDLVDKILAAKKQNQNTAVLEQQIDNMVYALYGLTDDEIKIINGVK